MNKSNIKSIHQSTLLEGFITYKQKLNLLDKTITEYIQYTDKFISWLIESDNAKLDKTTVDKMLSSVTKKIAQSYIFYLRESLSKGGLELKLNSVKKIRASIQQVYNFIVMEEELLGNCFNGLQIPKDEITEIKEYMYLHEARLIFDNCESTQHRLLIGLGLFNGLRVSETASIEVSNINLESGTMDVLRKGRRLRRIDIAEEIMEDMKNQVEICEALGREYLFQSPRGCKPMSTNAIRDTFDFYLDKLGLNEDYVYHMNRKVFCTNLYYNEDMKIHEISKLLDHSSIKVTEIYMMNAKYVR